MPSRISFQRRNSTSSSEYSDGSDHSRSTAPTEYSQGHSFKYYQNAAAKYYADDAWDEPYHDGLVARSSVETYASTIASDQDAEEDYPVFEETDYQSEPFTPSAIPSTPSEFSEYFPSTRRLCIRHDDTIDGNMNLRVDTETHTSKGRKVDLTLFHLRMHDLKNREFSFRRYCRDSGREICHSTRKYTKPAVDRRPGLQRSMSSALASFRNKTDSRTSTKASLKRHDSGYDSMEEDEEISSFKQQSSEYNSPISLPTNTTKLEFSNYAHINVKRRGAKSSKRYEFEYWGTAYVWRRVARKDGSSKEISYHLVNTETSAHVAHIVPTPMTPAESQEENAKGGWIPPCSMWISDQRILSGLTDVAE